MTPFSVALLLAVHEEAMRRFYAGRLAVRASLIARTLDACWRAGIPEEFIAVASMRGRAHGERDRTRSLEEQVAVVGQ